MALGARLASKIWVGALTARCQAAGLAVYVLHKGDEERGGVMIKHRVAADKVVLFEPGLLADGRRGWQSLTGEKPGDEASVDARIVKRRRFDPDLWVIEIDDPKQLFLLDQDPP